MTKQRTSLLCCPAEIRHLIYSKLSTNDLLSLAGTCREWYYEMAPVYYSRCIVVIRVSRQSTIQRLHSYPDIVRQSLQKAVLRIDKSWKEGFQEALIASIKIIREKLQLRYLQVIYHVPDLLFSGTGEPECAWPLIHDLYRQPGGLSASRKLILRLSGCTFDDCHQLSLWVQLCEDIRHMMATGTFLEELEIWIDSYKGTQRDTVLRLGETNIIDAIRTWNASRPLFVTMFHPHWLVPLIGITGLHSIKVRFSDTHGNILKQMRKAESRPVPALQAFLDKTMVFKGTGTSLKHPFDFKFTFEEDEDGHKLPIISY
ncbi:MAG: hypothetical protein Q9217_002521 [Psora testacea]